MYPVLVRFNGWHISSLGFLYTLAFLLAFLWSLRRAQAFGISKQAVCDVTIIAMLSFLVGSRAYYVMLHWSRFRDDPIGILDIFRGGTAQYGGVILLVAALFAYARLKRLSIARLGSTLSAPFFLGIAVGRLGCFANGCCFGLPASSFLGVHFPPWSQASRIARELLEDAAEVSIPGNTGTDVFVPAVHPTQLYSAAGALLCMGIVLWVTKKGGRPRTISGITLGLLGLLRLVVDRFRYYDPSMMHAGIPTNSWISLILIISSVVILARTVACRRTRKTRTV